MKDRINSELRKLRHDLPNEEEILKRVIHDMRQAFKLGNTVTYYRYKSKPSFLAIKENDEYLFVVKYKYLFETNGFSVEHDNFRKREGFTERMEEYVTLSDSNREGRARPLS